MKMLLKIENLTKAFGGVVAVDRVNLEIEKGEIRALIGPNGAGKTTLFNLVTKHLDPDKGKIIFQEQDISGYPPYQICRLGMARSFQRVNLFPKLTAFECVQMALLSQRGHSLNLLASVKKMLRDETMQILESVGLPEKEAFSYADELSQGEKKRLDFAITLGNDPQLVLMDEPTAGLGPEGTLEIVHLVKQLAETRKLTILFCEHDMSVVFGIADRITVLHQGRVICDGSPDEARSNETVQKVYLGEA
jgi:branched-chain amino acid transport system ATP-binding protein